MAPQNKHNMAHNKRAAASAAAAAWHGISGVIGNGGRKRQNNQQSEKIIGTCWHRRMSQTSNKYRGRRKTIDNENVAAAKRQNNKRLAYQRSALHAACAALAYRACCAAPCTLARVYRAGARRAQHKRARALSAISTYQHNSLRWLA